MSTIRSLANAAASDRRITKEEAQGLVNKAKADGKVTAYEKAQLRNVLTQYKDLFTPETTALIKPLLESPPTPTPGQVLPLDTTSSQRPVFVAPDGRFTVNANGVPASGALEQGDALFRAGELIDNAGVNVFANLPKELRGKIFDQLKPTLSATTAPAGLDANQTLQARASSGTVLLHLLEASPEPELAAPLLKAYEAMVKAEPNKRLQENLVFHLSNSPAAQAGEAKKVADTLLPSLTPIAPPYEKWFANGNKTVRMDWQIGDDFVTGFRNNLTNKGWKETAPNSGVYQKAITDPVAGETKFEIRTRMGGGASLLDKMNDPTVNIQGYDGHSNWGRNQVSSIKRQAEVPNGGDGKLYLSNLCVGKSQLDELKEKFPNLQVATTYGSSAVDTDIDGLAKMFAKRAGWQEITPFMDRVDGNYERNNFVTPASTLVREKTLDRDNDGQADYLDKHFNVSTFAVAADTAREFRPVKQDRPAELLDGTKINISAQIINTVSEFSGILSEVNAHSRVVANGWFEPKAGEADVVRFEKVKGKDGQPEYRMKVNARYSHMSEENMRATCVYEFNRWLQSSGEQPLDPVDRKIASVISYAQSLDIDDSSRDGELFSQFLSRYNLPADLPRQAIQALLDAEHSEYAGSEAMVEALKKQLSPATLAALKKPEVGEPVRYL